MKPTSWRALSAYVWPSWLVTRVVGVLMLSNTLPYWSGFGRVNGDVKLYAYWSDHLMHGGIPYKDFSVIYPPGIVPFLALPHTSINMYIAEFVALAIVADLVGLVLLKRSGDRPLGVVAWVVGLPLLGPVVWGRFDIFVAVALLAGMMALERRRAVTAGSLFAFAGLIKLWPFVLILLLLPLVDPRSRLRLCAGASWVAAAGVVPFLALGGWTGLRVPLIFEKNRGIEMESLPAVPLHIARSLGAAWHVDLQYGSMDLVMSHGDSAKFVATVFMGLMLVGLFLLALRDRGISLSPPQLLLLLVLGLLVFSRVLSPQYLVWAIAAVALCADRASDPRRLLSWTALALIATQALYPFKFPAVVAGTSLGLLMVIVHAAVILALAAVAVRDVLRRSIPSEDHQSSILATPEPASWHEPQYVAPSKALRRHLARSP